MDPSVQLFVKKPATKITGPYLTFSAANPKVCSLRCFTTQMCASFDYNKSESLCFMHGKRLDETSVEDIIQDEEYVHYEPDILTEKEQPNMGTGGFASMVPT